MKMMKAMARLPPDFNLFDGGLELKFALEEAEKLGTELKFGGVEFDPRTIEGLRMQPDMYPMTAMWQARKLTYHMSTLTNEVHDFYNILHAKGAEAFSESIDRSRINFLVHMLNKVAPKQKKIIIDQKDLRIFRGIWQYCPGRNVVAVVNQWHMQGI